MLLFKSFNVTFTLWICITNFYHLLITVRVTTEPCLTISGLPIVELAGGGLDRYLRQEVDRLHRGDYPLALLFLHR